MGRSYEDIQKNIKRLKAELLIAKVKAVKEKVDRVPVTSNDGGVPEGSKSFTVEGIKFYEIVPYKQYKVIGSSGEYEIIEAKRTGDHLYCNCPQMKFRGFRTNEPCKHERALAKYLGNIKFDGFKMVVL